MDFKKSKGPELLPREEPPGELLPESERDYLQSCPEDRRHIAFWTSALARLFEIQAPWKDVPGYRFATFGFADPDFEQDAFGAFIYATPGLSLGSERMSIEGYGFKFPVFIRRSVEIYHAPKINPTMGTATCWARSRRLSSPHASGLLTAKHLLVDPRIGTLCPTTSGYGKVIDVAPDGIDATLIEPPGVNTSMGTNGLASAVHVTPWTGVEIDGVQSGRVRTVITHVSDTRGSLSPVLPSRVFVATPGMSGDSGALVKDSQGIGVGIYMGEMADAAGRIEGFCQHLAQATQTMQLDLYE